MTNFEFINTLQSFEMTENFGFTTKLLFLKRPTILNLQLKFNAKLTL